MLGRKSNKAVVLSFERRRFEKYRYPVMSFARHKANVA